MTQTEKMTQEINDFLRLVGDAPLDVPAPDSSTAELVLLRQVKQEYTKRLLQKVPKYRALGSEDLIPDMFLMALRNREAELEAGQA